VEAFAYRRRACPPKPWRRREPEKTLLYWIVQEHWKTFVRFAEERDPRGVGLPKYVRNAFEVTCTLNLLGEW
jgi:hypothetical protein